MGGEGGLGLVHGLVLRDVGVGAVVSLGIAVSATLGCCRGLIVPNNNPLCRDGGSLFRGWHPAGGVVDWEGRGVSFYGGWVGRCLRHGWTRFGDVWGPDDPRRPRGGWGQREDDATFSTVSVFL